MSCLGLLLLAWILSWFGFDQIFVTGVNELFGISISVAGYYVIFFLFGLLIDIF